LAQPLAWLRAATSGRAREPHAATQDAGDLLERGDVLQWGWHRAAPHRRGTRLQLLLRKGRREARRRSRSRRGEHRTWNAVAGAALPSLSYPVAGDAMLSGIVVDGDGQPIAGATAHVCWDAFALAGERLDIRNVVPRRRPTATAVSPSAAYRRTCRFRVGDGRRGNERGHRNASARPVRVRCDDRQTIGRRIAPAR
jgi:hypothetical protein